MRRGKKKEGSWCGLKTAIHTPNQFKKAAELLLFNVLQVVCGGIRRLGMFKNSDEEDRKSDKVRVQFWSSRTTMMHFKMLADRRVYVNLRAVRVHSQDRKTSDKAGPTN
jgi:hypothetical protein